LTTGPPDMISPHMVNVQPTGRVLADEHATSAPRVPDGSRVYAIGDIHGRADLLSELHERIAADAAANAPSRRVIVYLGDYIDRGPESAKVLEILSSPPLDEFEAVFVKGNHEDLMLRYIDEGTMMRAWMSNGGSATLKSYGVGTLGILLGEAGTTRIRRKLALALPEQHRKFLDSLCISHEEGDYLFVHAGVRPGIPLAEQEPEDLMWIRHDFLNAEDDFGKIVVHGHSIRTKPDVKANRIGIDTGAFNSGRLTCLVLEGTERRFLATGSAD
jgi:serine/threonine protein phosphatase 1